MPKIKHIALIIDTSHPSSRKLLAGVAKYSQLYGPWEFYIAHREFYSMGDTKKEILEELDNKLIKADGIIIRELPSHKDILDWPIPVFKKKQVPTIIVLSRSDHLPGRNIIRTDSESIARMAVGHFTERGFKNFAFLSLKRMEWARKRAEYFHETVNSMGYLVETFEIRSTDRLKELNKELLSLKKWLKNLKKPSALLACNDTCGQYVLNCCMSLNIRVPEDIAVLGVDNDETICNLTYPPLSSIVLNTEKAGFESAKLLDDMMKGKTIDNQCILVSPEKVMVRHSSDILAISDEVVVSALRFIKDNIRRPLQVTDVIEAVATSRRGLYQKFKKILGLSVHETIKREKVKLICDHLIQTDLSISQIAYKLGFQSADHISRYFKQEKGESPKDFRKKFMRKP